MRRLSIGSDRFWARLVVCRIQNPDPESEPNFEESPPLWINVTLKTNFIVLPPTFSRFLPRDNFHPKPTNYFHFEIVIDLETHDNNHKVVKKSGYKTLNEPDPIRIWAASKNLISVPKQTDLIRKVTEPTLTWNRKILAKPNPTLIILAINQARWW